jgi:hypothetical protein
MDYCIKTYLPSLSTFEYFKEVKNKDIICLSKFIASNDNEGAAKYFTDILCHKVHNSYDKFFCLIFLRNLTVGNAVNIKFNNKKLKIDKAELKLNIVLSDILKNNNTIIADFEFEDVKVVFKESTEIYYKNFNSILSDVIEEVIIKETLTNYKELNEEIQKNIILRLKKEIKLKLKKHILEHSPYFNITLLKELNSIKLNLFNNSAFYFLKTIYTTSMSSFYTKLYHISHKLNLNYDNFLSLTPSETDLLLAIYKSQSTIK